MASLFLVESIFSNVVLLDCEPFMNTVNLKKTVSSERSCFFYLSISLTKGEPTLITAGFIKTEALYGSSRDWDIFLLVTYLNV